MARAMIPPIVELLKHDRIAICGGPGAGKTTLALSVHDRSVYHTDDVIDALPWSAVPDHYVELLRREARWCLEGVQAGRVLRRAHRDEGIVLADAVVWLEGGDGSAMARGCATIWRSVRPLLIEAGVAVYEGRAFESSGESEGPGETDAGARGAGR